ncbi:PqqD family peptide modification chaperone [uncultured Erythrobacter sp.]|uniref:PqqD family peptide modification chaperone n=1 Tax=uncultured Erythrobacter sp. TaxID=263913 RepID=UPI002627746E|nr:PqqD family peptide modification chaperone [uncultured Erythrobacter sp.]
MTNATIEPSTKLKQATGVVAADMNGETVMMDIEKGVYFALAGTGNQIWTALEAPATLGEIIEHIRLEFDVTDEDDLDQTVTEFLANLLEKGLVIKAD